MLKVESKKKAEPLISVIVPVYNVEKYINKCVDSIIGQDYANLEIILVDDGSPDNCGKICDEYKKLDKRVKVIHKSNGGLSSARNAGIEIAKGDYIGFVDSDDYIEPCMYDKLLKALLQEKCSLAICGTAYVFENGKRINKTNAGNTVVMDFEEALTEMNQYRLFDMGAWSKLYEARLFKNIRFPVGKLSEDFYIMYKIFDNANKIVFISDPAYNYLQRENSISRNKKINHDFEYAAKEQMEYLDKYHPNMSVLGHTSYASAALTVFDFYLKNKVKCPQNMKLHFWNIVKSNYKYIKKAAYLSTEKRIQFFLFKLQPSLYKWIFIAYRKIKKV